MSSVWMMDEVRNRLGWSIGAASSFSARGSGLCPRLTPKQSQVSRHFFIVIFTVSVLVLHVSHVSFIGIAR